MVENAHIAKILASARDDGVVLADPASARAEPVVLRSWRRCVARYGLEPHRTRSPKILTQTELKDFRAPVDDLIGLARGEIDRLFTRIGPDEYVVLLTDAHGVTVDFRCAARLLGDARAAGLYLGSIWAEADQGTNGVGTCVHEARPLSIVMDEHFSTRNIGLTCTVAPIFGPNHKLLGILDVSTNQPAERTGQTHVREIVSAAARRIENLHFECRHAGRPIVRLSYYRDFVDTAAELRIAVCDDGRVIEAGSGVEGLFGTTTGALIGCSLEQVFRIPSRSLDRGAHSIATSDHHGRALFARIEPPGRARANRAPSVRRNPTSMGRLRSAVCDLEALAGDDPVMLANLAVARKVLDRGLPIVLMGETGVGKGLFARALHDASMRAAKPFVAINCAAIPRELIESELFGYRPGAFTGAAPTGCKGRLLEANGGTLFLDEVGDMPRELQTRLLHVLSEREVTPVGAGSPVPLDLAVISATLHNLPDAVRRGAFREDLYFRLSGVALKLPVLRERRDKERLIDLVFSEEAELAGTAVEIAQEARAILLSYDWPGNLRELRHVAKFAVAVTQGTTITPCDLPPSTVSGAGLSMQAGVTEFADLGEVALLRAALERAGWNVTAAAKLMKLSRATVHRKIVKYRLSVARKGQ